MAGSAVLVRSVLAVVLARSASADVIACQCGQGDEVDIYVMKPDGSGRIRLTDSRGEEGHPSFSPDGQRLAFHGAVTGNFEIYVMEIATRQITRLTHGPSRDIEPVWNRDGKGLYFTSDRAGRNEIHVLDVATRKISNVFGASGVDTQEADPSPDGKSLAFTQSGYVNWRWYVGILDLAAKTSRLLTGAGNCRPSWSPDGKALYYSERRAGSHAIVKLDVGSSNVQEIAHTPDVSYYDVRPSPDGLRLAFHGHPYKQGGASQVYVLDPAGGRPRSVAKDCAYPDWGQRSAP